MQCWFLRMESFFCESNEGRRMGGSVIEKFRRRLERKFQ
jgi:hypothetical protein